MKTPAEELGYEVGMEFEVLYNSGNFSKGSKVILIEDNDPSSAVPLFELVTGECSASLGRDGALGNYEHINHVAPTSRTLVEELGYEVGMAFEVVNDNSRLSRGSKVILHKDHGSRMPEFKLVTGKRKRSLITDNRSVWLSLSDIKPLARNVEKKLNPNGSKVTVLNWIEHDGSPQCPVFPNNASVLTEYDLELGDSLTHVAHTVNPLDQHWTRVIRWAKMVPFGI